MHPRIAAFRRPETTLVISTLNMAQFHEGRALDFGRSDEPPKSLIKAGLYPYFTLEAPPAMDAGALDLAVELALHYRDRHLGRRRGEPRVHVCRCSRFDSSGDPFLRRLHAEIYSTLSKGGLQDLLLSLETASGRRGLSPTKEDPIPAVA